MRKFVAVLVLVVLLIPAIVLAQGTVEQIVELVFTDGGAQVGITQQVQSVASVTMELNGQQYLVKVPVTIDIDTAVPLESASLIVPAAARVGSYGVAVTLVTEYEEAVSVTMPGYWGTSETDFEPSPGNKLVVVEFDITNVGQESDSISSYEVQGVDDTGRLFEEIDMSCPEVNPGQTDSCVAVYDLAPDVVLVGLDIKVDDHRQITFPVESPAE